MRPRLPRQGIVASATLVALVVPALAHAGPGVLVRSYGFGGIAHADFPGSAAGYAAALQSDGKSVVVGTNYDRGRSHLAVARFTKTGFLDGTFSGDGMATVRFDATDASLSVQPWTGMHVLIASNGSITAVGTLLTRTGATVCCPQIFAARLTSRGALDRTFGSGGRLIADPFPIPGGGELLGGAALARDRSLLIVASVQNTALSFIARYDARGRADQAFGIGGLVIIDRPPGATKIAIDSRDRATVVGIAIGPTGGFAMTLCRFTADGTRDITYGLGGCSRADEGERNAAPRGLVTYGGYTYVLGEKGFPGTDWYVARANSNGAFDTRFGKSGFATIKTGEPAIAVGLAVGSKHIWLSANRVTCDSDGLCRLVGTMLARFTSKGFADARFGLGGRARLPSKIPTVGKLVLQGSNALVSAGESIFGIPGLGAAMVQG